jgi:hypothetical protein
VDLILETKDKTVLIFDVMNSTGEFKRRSRKILNRFAAQSMIVKSKIKSENKICVFLHFTLEGLLMELNIGS